MQFKVELHYLRRARRATLRLKPEGVVRVSLPYGANESEVKKWIQSKTNWILEKYRLLENSPKKKVLKFITGESFPFYGQSLQLQVIEGKTAVILNENTIVVSVPASKVKNEEFVKSQIIKWYKLQALEKIKTRVDFYTKLLGVSAKSVSLKNYKARWGACSSKADLIFNWQIITFVPRLFDYVVAHEICHLKEMNHSKKFYSHLSQLGFTKKEIHPQFKNLRNIF